jgi:DNA invertase Pin-like site-specific DNA recombinase
VRQSTSGQVHENLESQRRQYALVDLARTYGFQGVRVIDDDLGRSASGTIERPGFRSLVGQVCEGLVGAVFCLEASRLARNGRDWHHLLELCGFVSAYVIDSDGAYDPSAPNHRLLLGLKGTMSEFELTLLRKRMLEAALAKARRGELRVPVPMGYVWSAELGLMMDPDRRVQEAVRTIFRLFDRLGSARQVLLHMRRKGLTMPRPLDGRHATPVAWRAPVYRTVIAVVENPFYAGAYAYGKSQTRTTIVEGIVRKVHGRRRPMEAWTALVRDHHDGYITWDEFEQNQQRLACNAFRKPAGGAKAGARGSGLAGGPPAVSTLRPDAPCDVQWRTLPPPASIHLPGRPRDARPGPLHHDGGAAPGCRHRPADSSCGAAGRRGSCSRGRTGSEPTPR